MTAPTVPATAVLGPAQVVQNANGAIIGIISPDGMMTNISGSEFPNVSAMTLNKYRKALANVRDNSGRCKIALVGDSTTAGWGATTGTNGLTGARAKSFPSFLASILTSAGYPATSNSIFGDANNPGVSTVSYSVYDPRVVLPGDWGGGSGALTSTAGGQLFRAGSAITSTLSFTPTGNVDTFDIYTVQSSGNGVLTANINGGATLATIDQNNATRTVVKTTVTNTLGANTLNLQRISGGTVFVAGVVAYDSTSAKIELYNMGASGWATADYAYQTEVWSPANQLAFVAPDLTIINLGINDYKDTPVSIATFKANMQTLITKALTSGDCILMVPFPSQTTRATISTQASFSAAIYDLAQTNNIGLIDLTKRFTDWTTANSRGFAFNDLHPNRFGYADIASAIARALKL